MYIESYINIIASLLGILDFQDTKTKTTLNPIFQKHSLYFQYYSRKNFNDYGNKHLTYSLYCNNCNVLYYIDYNVIS